MWYFPLHLKTTQCASSRLEGCFPCALLYPLQGVWILPCTCLKPFPTNELVRKCQHWMIQGNACSASCVRVCVAGGGGGFAFGSLLKYHLRRNCEVTKWPGVICGTCPWKDAWCEDSRPDRQVKSCYTTCKEETVKCGSKTKYGHRLPAVLKSAS